MQLTDRLKRTIDGGEFMHREGPLSSEDQSLGLSNLMHAQLEMFRILTVWLSATIPMVLGFERRSGHGKTW